MLLELHIKNMALIEKADLDFYNGLTVLSGETGAGKSILIDAINFALGAKVSRDIIREGEDFAYTELIFKVEDAKKIEYIKSLDFNIADDGLVLISRKLTESRSVQRVNDESVTLTRLSALTHILIDIHGQHEHQSLLSPSKQLDILDSMLDEAAGFRKEELGKLYTDYKRLSEKLGTLDDDFVRDREIDILKYEIREIENAKLKANEEEKLNTAFRKLKAISDIDEHLKSAFTILKDCNIGEAAAELREVSSYDKRLEAIEQALTDVDANISDLSLEINKYLEGLEYDEENFEKIQKRLDFVNRFTSKYTKDIDKLAEILRSKKLRLKELTDFSANKSRFEEELKLLSEKYTDEALALREDRKKAAKKFEKEIIENLSDLNFLNVEFAIRFKEQNSFTSKGLDDIDFMLSTNPGNPLKPLKDIASGGELSRIMLAFKAVLADTDDIETLIFDEIDTGISGRTAQKVAQKLSVTAKNHQVLCITHLPQIAAMADYNYLIEKSSDKNETKTHVTNIKASALIDELARLLGGSEITTAVLGTAKEMKELADKFKNR